MKARLERILNKLANQYTPALPSQTRGENRLRLLADGLAREGVLVIAGHVPPHVTSQQVVNDWVAAYYDLHQLLTQALFPSHTGLRVTDADGQHPPVFVLYSDVCAVTKTIGGYVVPFVAGQPQHGQYYLSHLKGIMTYLIDDLEGGDLSASESNQLAEDGVPILQRLLNSVVQQDALTSPTREMSQHIQQMPPPPPPFLPEDGQSAPKSVQNGGASPANAKPSNTGNDETQPAPHTPNQDTQPASDTDIHNEPPVEHTDTGDMFVPIFFKRPTKNGQSGKNRRRRKRNSSDE
jgi:hypothetical protein